LTAPESPAKGGATKGAAMISGSTSGFFLGGRRPVLAGLVLAALLLQGCASSTASIPPAEVPDAAADAPMPPDPNIKPLTVEQEETVAGE
jgi:hypothetical protein